MTDAEVRSNFEAAGQGHVFRFFDELQPEAREPLVEQARSIDLKELDRLHKELILGSDAAGDGLDFKELEPASFEPLPENGGAAVEWIEAKKLGEDTLRAGKVAAFVVAGGQGTRLGFDGPKGTFGVTPVLKKSLFQVFAEKILAANLRYGCDIPWFILTSTINHEATVRFFESHDYFGLTRERVHFITQGLMPAVDADGKILLVSKDRIAMSPDGHGGSLRALAQSGSLQWMKEHGINTVSYFQVDNPLVRCIDPAFIGFHVGRVSQLSSKALPKAYPEEKVGVFCQQGKTRMVVEYSDLPTELAEATDDEGDLKFRSGSIAIHLFDREFIETIGSGEGETRLPFHLAHKKIATIDDSGNPVNPTEPNGYKFEMFVFDALPFARNPVIIETSREDDFSPVKNAEGIDSVETATRDQLRQFARWAQAAGLAVNTDATGLPEVSFEVSPLFADCEQTFRTAADRLHVSPEIFEGLILT